MKLFATVSVDTFNCHIDKTKLQFRRSSFRLICFITNLLKKNALAATLRLHQYFDGNVYLVLSKLIKFIFNTTPRCELLTLSIIYAIFKEQFA